MIILSCDHAGFDLMVKIQEYFKKHNVEFVYLGPKEFNKDDDYPDFIIPATNQVLKNKDNIGIFACGSGIGANIVANRQKGIRAVCAYDYTTAYLARKDEDANVLTLGARITNFRTSLKIIKVFLTSEFEGGRHIRRINKY